MEPWEHLISKQPHWVQELLDEVNFSDGFPNPFAIMNYFDKEWHFITVSDGSVIFHNMSFGWVLASPDVTLWAQEAGQCAGCGNLLRSEGAGMLAVTVFMSLVNKEYNFLFLNKITKSEFDITKQIFRTTKAYNISAIYNWVQGHQDWDKEYHKLDTNARLNVDADRLAGEYQRRKGTFRPLSPILPSCPAMVSIQGISVTSNIFKDLVRAYTEPQFMEYLQTKYQWSDSTIHSIA